MSQEPLRKKRLAPTRRRQIHEREKSMAKKKPLTQTTDASGPVWGRRIAGKAGKANVAYCAGWDVREKQPADLRLLPCDLQVNRAHCIMLAETGIINVNILRRILSALDKLEKLAESGKFCLKSELEDIHLNIENFVEESEGLEVAGVMHTARSRNDQVATGMRIYLRGQTIQFAENLTGLIKSLLRLARRHANTIMPGLTHHQPAAWTTFGHWAAAHTAAFSRDLIAIADIGRMMNECPLGAAASFGTSWPIDRKLTAKLLGFDNPQENSLDAVTNRAEAETRIATALALWAQHAATMAQDLILFSSPPWHLLRIGDAFVTGSSIMPQKRNPDFAEVTKAKASLAGAMAGALLGLTRGDPSGYNREQQWSKYLIMDLFDELADAPAVLMGALESIQVDKKRMITLMRNDFLEAADVADYLAQTRKVPFRQTYRWLGEAVRRSEEIGISLPEAVNLILRDADTMEELSGKEIRNLSSPEFLVERRKSRGGPAPQSVRNQAHYLELQLADCVARLRILAKQHAGAPLALKRRIVKALRGA